MQIKKSALLLLALLMLGSVFFPWVVIESKGITITGMNAAGTAYGKPGVLTLLFGGLVFIFALVPRIWAHRICLFASALHAGWALRNFLILSGCQGGDCPARQPAFYVYLISSFLLLVAVLLQDVKMPAVTEEPL
ncbi:MAG TPA: hypothetical protein VM010_06160 [Chitinophagaceae bacterium]|nr:hypothetical protein [Chitinophagaceae bacterium]